GSSPRKRLDGGQAPQPVDELQWGRGSSPRKSWDGSEQRTLDGRFNGAAVRHRGRAVSSEFERGTQPASMGPRFVTAEEEVSSWLMACTSCASMGPRFVTAEESPDETI